MKKSSNQFIVLIIIAMCFWGGAWAAGKIISGMVDPDVIVFWRFLFSLISFSPFLLILKPRMKVDRKSAIWIIVSIVFYTLYNQLFFKGLSFGLAGAGGVLVTTTNPIFTQLLVMLFLRSKPSTRTVIGLLIGLVGGFFLLRLWTFQTVEIFQLGNILFLLASFAWAVLTIASQNAQKSVPFFAYTFYIYLGATLLQFVFAFNKNPLVVFEQGAIFWINLLYLSLIAMAFASGVYFMASKKLGSHRASSFIFLVPVTALLSTFLILKEVPRWDTVLGGTLALFAVYIINSQKERNSTLKKWAD